MANKRRKCKWCLEYTEAEKGLKVPAGFFCSISHAQQFAIDKMEKQKQRQLSKQKQIKANALKEERKQLKKRKQELKPLSKWLDELQALFNRYIRLRDAKCGCISCEKPFDWYGQWHASHYISRGHSSFLRFHLWNVHKSCSVCNSHLSGNIGEYTPNLIKKIGEERFEYLISNKSNVKKFDIEYIKRAIRVCKKAIKMAEKRL